MVRGGAVEAVGSGAPACGARRVERRDPEGFVRAVGVRGAGDGRGTPSAPAGQPSDDEFVVDWALAAPAREPAPERAP